MPRTGNKRERLVEAAKSLIHQQGYSTTTLADIAQASGVPLGNVYYYFKTKDDIAAAVIAEYTEGIRSRLRLWEDISDPRERLIAFVELVSGNRQSVAKHGCPVGSLCQELNKDRTPLSDKADSMLKAQLKWVTKQFRLMGKEDASDLAQQLMATLQGVSLLANALNSTGVVDRQGRRLKDWLRTL